MEGKNGKIKAVAAVIAIAAAITVLILLIPKDIHNRELEKYEQFAVAAETDPRAKAVLKDIEKYPSEMIFYYNEHILLKEYDEAEETLSFIYDYDKHKNDYASMSFTDEELNSAEVPALYMSDRRWCYEKLYDEYIYQGGCAAVAITMANLYLRHNSDVDPVTVARLAENIQSDMTLLFGGINSQKIPEICNNIGLECKTYNYDSSTGGSGEADIETIRSIIESGHIAMIGTLGDTFGGHSLIVTSCSENGDITLNDPASPKNTGTVWSFEQLKPEIYYIWDLS